MESLFILKGKSRFLLPPIIVKDSIADKVDVKNSFFFFSFFILYPFLFLNDTLSILKIYNILMSKNI